jgi:hypothetical protein
MQSGSHQCQKCGYWVAGYCHDDLCIVCCPCKPTHPEIGRSIVKEDKPEPEVVEVTEPLEFGKLPQQGQSYGYTTTTAYSGYDAWGD